MKIIYRLILTSLLLALVGCNSVQNIQLNTLRPTEVSYHRTHPSVVIVNNCTDDSLHESSRYIDENGRQYRLTSDIDSISQFMTMSLGTHLYDSRAFERIEIFTPDSNNTTGIIGIEKELLNEWQSYAPDDIHIAINAIVPTVTMQVTPFDGIFCSDMSVVSQAFMQCFIPDREAINLSVCDTLYWQSYGDTPYMANSYLPDFEECIDEAMGALSLKVANIFAPHFRVVSRYIFSTGHPAMKDAFKYWNNNQYTEASYIWEYVYKYAKDKGRRAKAAANLAVYNEIEDNYTDALKYAQEAASIFVNINEVEAAQYTINYCSDLESRIEEAPLLDNVME
ncbi:MAG: hypothetical protein IKK16_00895 [Bacteroidaceae bacterium]|nr:hypothetical protein [Bacteroidaceae bacterium]